MEKVKGEIIKVLEKESKYGGVYYDCLFRMIETGSVLRSCIYPGCRNFSTWESLLVVGNVLSELDLIEKFGKVFVDADSTPELLRKGNAFTNQNLKPMHKSINAVQQGLFN